MLNSFEKKPKKPQTPSPEEEPKTEIWGGVTDPKKHNPKKFRYLVHAFNPYIRIPLTIATITAEISGIYKVDKSEGDQSINLFEEPERLHERVSLSMSLIDQDHTATWGEGGIIVEAPEENIIITSPTDTGSHTSSKDFLIMQAQSHSRLSGDQLLQYTSDKIYNEVVAFGTSENGKKLRLVGFFIKVDKKGQPTDPLIAEKMKYHAKRLNLPLIEIQTKGLFEQEKFEIVNNSIWVNYNGNRYNLGNDNPKFAFIAYDDKGNPFFPSPQEIEDVITHFVERGDLDQTQAQQIRERYKDADSQRKSPKVEYDPKTGEINQVIIKDGYGESEIEYYLNSSGYCYKVNTKEHRKAFREISLNPQRIRREIYIQLSSSEVLSILESRKETMEPEEYKKLFEFFNGIKDKIDQQYQQSLVRRLFSIE